MCTRAPLMQITNSRTAPPRALMPPRVCAPLTSFAAASPCSSPAIRLSTALLPMHPATLPLLPATPPPPSSEAVLHPIAAAAGPSLTVDTTSLTKARQGSSQRLASSVWVAEGRECGKPGRCTKDRTQGGTPVRAQRQTGAHRSTQDVVSVRGDTPSHTGAGWCGMAWCVAPIVV
jgi:hypothetical protein